MKSVFYKTGLNAILASRKKHVRKFTSVNQYVEYLAFAGKKRTATFVKGRDTDFQFLHVLVTYWSILRFIALSPIFMIMLVADAVNGQLAVDTIRR